LQQKLVAGDGVALDRFGLRVSSPLRGSDKG
jgi:hypothetical protein